MRSSTLRFGAILSPSENNPPIATPNAGGKGRIRILSDRVANQIAAGEVVERPVAVVKELVENCLDADATRITVDFNAGGKSWIRVEDNGAGMSQDDALLALERHATSKIQSVDDILHVHSFGFRGEALPSIASVSRFTLRTRPADQESGTEIFILGGKHIHTHACGMPTGTCIEVANLFHSVPARRKFLKTDRTEAAHIVHFCRMAAIAHPEVAFTLTENGNEVFRSPVCPGLRERIVEVFGKDLTRDLQEINAEDSRHGLRLTGLIERPGQGRATRAHLHCFVNRRPIESRTIQYALLESYHTYLPKGRYPIVFLFLEIDPQAVDVNVHPAKREVRFRDEAGVRRFLIESVLQQLQEASRALRQNATSTDSPAVKSVPVNPLHRPTPKAEPSEIPSSRSATQAPPETIPKTPPPSEPFPSPQPSDPRREPEPPVAPAKPPDHTAQDHSASPPARNAPAPRPAPWVPLGIAHGRFLLYQSREGVVLLNWRAARARILYENILRNLRQRATRQQSLLFPISLELDSVASAVLEEYMEFFRDLGFAVEPFGRHFFRLEAIPEWFEPSAGERFLRDLVDRIRDRGIKPKASDTAREEVAALAAMAAIQGESTPSPDHWGNLAANLFTCKDPLTDPRGHPVFFEINRAELRKRLALGE